MHGFGALRDEVRSRIVAEFSCGMDSVVLLLEQCHETCLLEMAVPG